MAINKHNYEAYFLDYHEGNLGRDDMHALMAFLDDNPELNEEFERYEKIEFTPDPEISYKGKDSLKKEIIEEDKLIAYLEGDLHEDEANEIKMQIKQDKQAALELQSLKNTVARPELSIRFPGKESLKKKERLLVPPKRIYSYAAAAVILLLIGFSSIYFFRGLNSTDTERIMLAKTDSYRVSSISGMTSTIPIAERETIAPRMRFAERESITLAKLSTGKANQIDNPYADMSVSYLTDFRVYEFPSYGFDNTEEALAQEGTVAKKTTAGRIISGFFNRVSSPLKANETNKEKKSSGFSIWDLAEFGVKGVNALGDHDYTLVRQYNENGNVKGVMILEE